MAEVLSQSQIDALLNSLQNSEEETVEDKPKQSEPEYRKYDFFSPKKYTKDKLKMLRSVYDNYARIFASQINGLFRVASEVEVVGVEEQRYYEFSNALNENDIIALVQTELVDHSSNPPIIYHIDPILMSSMIDHMLGGTGTVDMTVDMSYTYTEIELALYEKIIKYPISITSDVWGGYLDLKVEFDGVEENPSMFQEISVDETVVIIMLTINMGGVSGIMNICIPGTLMSNIFEIIDKTKHIANKNGIEVKGNRDDIMESIRESKMDVMAQLGIAQLNLDDVYNLHVGDVIDLNKPQNSLVSLYVEGQPWFNGQLGVHHKNMAFKIVDRILESKEEAAG